MERASAILLPVLVLAAGVVWVRFWVRQIGNPVDIAGAWKRHLGRVPVWARLSPNSPAAMRAFAVMAAFFGVLMCVVAAAI